MYYEIWQIIMVFSIIQILYFLYKFVVSRQEIVHPVSITALALLIWFYPKVPMLATHYSYLPGDIDSYLLFVLACQTSMLLGMSSKFSFRLLSCSYLQNNKEIFSRWSLAVWFMFIIGAYAFYKYSKLSPNLVYMRQPTGIMTIYLFFSTFLTMSMIGAFFLLVKGRIKSMLIPITTGLLLYFDRILIHGKRSELFELLFLFAVLWSVYFKKKVPWVVVILGGIVVFVFNSTVSDYRGVMKNKNHDVAELTNIPFKQRIIETSLKPDFDIINSFVTYAAYNKNDVYFLFGADYWNIIVRRYFPGQILGQDFKRSLLIPVEDVEDVLWRKFQYIKPAGTTTFLPGDIYRNFGWLGLIVLFLYGMYMQHIYNKSKMRMVEHLILYTYLGAMIPIILVFGVRWFVAGAIFWIPLISIIGKLCTFQNNFKRKVSCY